jgi:hypothetical protein
MKLSNTWFALILIASASLLNAGKNVNAASPSPAPKPVPLASESAQKPRSDEQRAQSAPSALKDQQSTDQSKTAAAADAAADHYERVSEDTAVAQVVFAFFLTIFTGILGVVAFQQWRGYKNLERGAIIVDEIELGNFLPDSKLPPQHATYVTFRFRNIGRTPVRLIQSKVQFHLAMEMVEPPDYGEHPLNMKGQTLPQGEGLFRMYQLYDPRLPLSRLPDVTFDMITSTNDMFLVLYGYVRYVDAFGQRHRHGFGFQYSPIASIVSKRSQFQTYGSDAYNYTKQERR